MKQENKEYILFICILICIISIYIISKVRSPNLGLNIQTIDTLYTTKSGYNQNG